MRLGAKGETGTPCAAFAVVTQADAGDAGHDDEDGAYEADHVERARDVGAAADDKNRAFPVVGCRCSGAKAVLDMQNGTRWSRMRSARCGRCSLTVVLDLGVALEALPAGEGGALGPLMDGAVMTSSVGSCRSGRSGLWFSDGCPMAPSSIFASSDSMVEP